MIVRVIKELWAERGVLFFSLFLILLLTFGLSILQVSNYSAKSCGMDAFAFASEWMSISTFIVSSFFSIAINKNNFNSERVVLSKNNSSVWNFTIIKTALISFIMAVFIFVLTLTFSKIFFSDFINYNTKESIFYLFTGHLLDEVKYGLIFISYFCQSFFGICTAAIIPLITFWYFKSYIIGAAGVVVANLVGNALGADFIYEQNVFYDKMTKGIDIRYHFIFPALVLIILIMIGSMKTKRDFI